MKVVLFCGGFGMRLREFSESIPKPMVNIGDRPIMWHLMKYYAHQGHKEFILCLGWGAKYIKDYFLNYDECASNDFVLKKGEVGLRGSDIHDWEITFIDTGMTSNIGQRLKRVEPLLRHDETFLANYTDGLSNIPLSELIQFHYQKQAIATFVSVKPSQSFHQVTATPDGSVQTIERIHETDCWMNGGFFVLNRQIFDYLHEGDELVEEPFQRLIQQQRLATYRYEGYWACMDTYKEKQDLDDRNQKGDTPWAIWNHEPQRSSTLNSETMLPSRPR